MRQEVKDTKVEDDSSMDITGRKLFVKALEEEGIRKKPAPDMVQKALKELQVRALGLIRQERSARLRLVCRFLR